MPGAARIRLPFLTERAMLKPHPLERGSFLLFNLEDLLPFVAPTMRADMVGQ
jgi:hypothetical protein